MSTKNGSLRRSEPHVEILSGTWRPKDAFYLATDAIAQWLLSEHEAGRSPWQTLFDLGSDAQVLPFADWVTGLRSEQGLHNDDTTLLCVEVV